MWVEYFMNFKKFRNFINQRKLQSSTLIAANKTN